MKRIICVGIFGALMLATSPAQAQWAIESGGKGSVGLSHLWETIKVKLGIRGDWDKEVLAVGPKFSYYFFLPNLQKRDLRFAPACFVALEGNYISFGTEKVKGNGYYAQATVGVQCWINRNVSAYAEIGPGYVSLKDSGTGITNSETSIVNSVGIGIHF